MIDTDAGIVDSVQHGARTSESARTDERKSKVFSARSRDLKHLDGWATKIAMPKEDGEHVSEFKEPNDGPEES